MRKRIVILLLCSTGLFGQSFASGSKLASRSKQLLAASFAAVTTAEMADCASSWGKMEANPVLGQSRFGIGHTGIKLGIVSAILTGQYLFVRHRGPTTYKALAIANFASAAALGAVAYRNTGVPKAAN